MIRTAVLEANLTRHCINRCVTCNHASAFAKPNFMDPVILDSDLHYLSQKLHTSFFCLQGGEPLLHPELLQMMDIAFQSGIADNYGILTNGRLFKVMPEEFWQKCRDQKIELRCSVYGNLSKDVQDHAQQKAGQYQINYRPGPIYGFHKVLGDYPNGESFYGCAWTKCHTVHEGHFYICPLSAFWPEEFMDLPSTIDGFPIVDTSEEELNQFINRKTPLVSCKKCTGGRAPAVEWHECSSREQWIKESTV